nr:hypothetical protein [uncultured Campylobacter sp.]
MKQVFLAILLLIGFCGCAVSIPKVEQQAYNKEAAEEAKYIINYVVGEDGYVDKSMYDHFWEVINSIKDPKEKFYTIVFLKDNNYPPLVFVKEFMASALETHSKHEVVKTVGFKSYEADITSLYKHYYDAEKLNRYNELIPKFNNRLKRLAEGEKDIAEEREFVGVGSTGEKIYGDPFVGREDGFRLLYNGKQGYYRFSVDEVTQELKQTADAINRLDILFTENYKGDFPN